MMFGDLWEILKQWTGAELYFNGKRMEKRNPWEPPTLRAKNMLQGLWEHTDITQNLLLKSLLEKDGKDQVLRVEKEWQSRIFRIKMTWAYFRSVKKTRGKLVGGARFWKARVGNQTRGGWKREGCSCLWREIHCEEKRSGVSRGYNRWLKP